MLCTEAQIAESKFVPNTCPKETFHKLKKKYVKLGEGVYNG